VVVAAAAQAQAAGAARDGPVTIYELDPDFSYGYRCGVKQPLGAGKNGLSVHQITRSNWPQGSEGNPDNLLWVDEVNGVSGIAVRPTDEFHDDVTNPGGMVSFSADGTIWYTYGARSQDLPLRLFGSVQPYDPSAFVKYLHNFAPITGSTTPCVNVHDPKLLLFWRNGHSAGIDTSVRFRRYDIPSGFWPPEIEMNLGGAMDHEALGRVGIEQLWTRHDPRVDYTFLSWQFFRVETLQFGSNPFLYTDDDGVTWRTADGAAWTQFPIHYTDINDILVPFDHIAEGGSTNWLVSDLGIAPDGTFWMTLRADGTGAVDFWLFDGLEWTSRPLAMVNTCKPHACGATGNHVVFVYSDARAPNVLSARVSSDGGDTWWGPIVLDELDASLGIAWVSFVQPADAPTDGFARFFYGYARSQDAQMGLRYANSIRWIRLDADALRPADIDGDGVVGMTDFLALLAAWGPCPEPCPPNGIGDIDGDCAVGITDVLKVLAGWD
jgi:hypothetical protein